MSRAIPRRRALPVLSACLVAAAAGLGPPGAAGADDDGGRAGAPALVVLLVVDQLRADLLTRYDALFTGGFRRLLDEGRVYRNATHDHLVTETSPGHATLATGVHPSRHGVVANYWWVLDDRGEWSGVENVVDPTTPLLGQPQYAGATPRVRERSGIADWLLEGRAGARAVSLGGKDRGAVLLGAAGGGLVYWFEAAFGRFHTSAWYRDADPPWVERFNEGTLRGLMDSVWTSTVPEAARTLSRPDTATFEGDGVHTAFPHSRAAHAAEGAGGPGLAAWWSGTPGPDRAVLLLAREAVEGEGLGVDGPPDLLTISLSQTDLVGHAYGPLSREQLDNLLRLDRELGAFFDWLDTRVGEGAWTVVVTSDHGAQDAPETVPGGLRLVSDSLATLQRAVDEALMAADAGGASALEEALARQVTEIPWIARAWTGAQLGVVDASAGTAADSSAGPAGDPGEPVDSFTRLARRSWRADRPTGVLGRLGVTLLYAPNVLPFGHEHGSTHQSGYHHDRWIPLVFMGWGVEKGAVDEPVGAVDVAPTLATLLGVEAPDDLDGRPLELR